MKYTINSKSNIPQKPSPNNVEYMTNEKATLDFFRRLNLNDTQKDGKLHIICLTQLFGHGKTAFIKTLHFDQRWEQIEKVRKAGKYNLDDSKKRITRDSLVVKYKELKEKDMKEELVRFGFEDTTDELISAVAKLTHKIVFKMIFPFLRNDHFEWFYENKIYENLNEWVSGLKSKYTIMAIDEIEALTDCHIFQKLRDYNPLEVSMEVSNTMWKCLQYYKKIPHVSLVLLGKNSKIPFVVKTEPQYISESYRQCLPLYLELFKENDVFQILKNENEKKGYVVDEKKLRKQSRDIIENTGGIPGSVLSFIQGKNDEVKKQIWEEKYNLLYHYFDFYSIQKNIHKHDIQLGCISHLLNNDNLGYCFKNWYLSYRNVSKLDLFILLSIPFEFRGEYEVQLQIPESYLKLKQPSSEELEYLSVFLNNAK